LGVPLEETFVAGCPFQGAFAPYPRRTERVDTVNWKDFPVLSEGGRWLRVREWERFLAKTTGRRSFPWRVFVLADEPSRLCEADIVHALSRPADPPRDFSWVRPGKAAWDWWNNWDNRGQKAFCTTAGYRRFIDFAAKAGLEYVILDEGWSDKLDIWTNNPAVDLDEIISHH